jgi:hypothetical protein
VQEVVDLVYERVLPADDLSVGPPPLPERMVGLADQHLAEALGTRPGLGVDEVHLKLVEPLELEHDRPLRAVDLEAQRVLAPATEREASIVQTAPLSNSTAVSNASSTSTDPPGC